MPAINEALKKGDLGPLNPVPYCMMVLNCWGWTMYGYLKQDFFICCANFEGIAIGHYYLIVALILLSRQKTLLEFKIKKPIGLDSVVEHGDNNEIKRQASQEQLVDSNNIALSEESEKEKEEIETKMFYCIHVMWFAPFIWGILGIIAFVALGDRYSPDMQEEHDGSTTAQLLIGGFCVACTVLYFAAPLSTMAEVIRISDASSIYPPMVLCNLASCCLWTTYGFFGTNDPLLWAPNLTGCLLQVLNLVLVFVYGRKSANLSDAKQAALGKTEPLL